jgi:membrane-associated protease RseP (regulator of RpoE activity)
LSFNPHIGLDTGLALVAGVLGFLFVFNVGTALLGAAFGVPIERIQFGYSPTMRLFRIGRTEVRLGLFLFGGYVRYVAPEDGGPYAPWPVRILTSLAGPASALAVGAILLGGRMIDEALIAWPQMWAVLTDWSAPVNLDDALRPSLQAGGTAAAAAVVAVKAAMFNLLPLPFLAGGVVVFTLAEAILRRDFYTRLPQPVLFTSFFLMIGFQVVFVWRALTGA